MMWLLFFYLCVANYDPIYYMLLNLFWYVVVQFIMFYNAAVETARKDIDIHRSIKEACILINFENKKK